MTKQLLVWPSQIRSLADDVDSRHGVSGGRGRGRRATWLLNVGGPFTPLRQMAECKSAAYSYREKLSNLLCCDVSVKYENATREVRLRALISQEQMDEIIRREYAKELKRKR